ncbi:hypothetical protein B0H66DRAFT_380603 [Apodospora peruviana]|uniref:pH-response transcription factor pacC/RIM101 n=1 Tax=Apodospora peruviana TaxID=516989 RepID=A0AAE0HTT7_9PEZI|nr:hypothetical protein B0H66DRAFT_380603 [Apodospora peruviana]
MLSNPPQQSGLHSRQRQHRRQNSTPSAFEAVKIAPLPNFQQRQSVSHRRGLSLDTRRQLFTPSPATTTFRQDYTTVSTSTTNTGLSTTPQHLLRETQQQRTSRPGHGQSQYGNIATKQQQQQQQQIMGDEFLMSPNPTPLHPQFAEAMAAQGQITDLNSLPFDAYMGPNMNAMMKKNQANFASNNAINTAQDFEFFGPDSALSTPTFMTFPEASPAGSGQGWISEGETASTHTRRTSRRISNGILDKVAKFEAMGTSIDASEQRPATPPNHSVNGYFPPTPTESPHDRFMKHEAAQQQQQQRPNRFSDNYDESMEETIKPMRGNRSSNRNSGIFQDLRQQAEAELQQTPQRANTLPMYPDQLRTPDFMSMTNLNTEFVKIEHGFDGLPTGRLSISSDMSSHHPSPLTSSMGGMSQHSAFDHKPDLRPETTDFDSQNTIMPHHQTESPVHQSFSSATSSRRGSPHRRTESIASIQSAASIASINIEETKTDTGVTLDDIATYIEGPDPSDGKWICRYDDCGKRFGRKENIKSHVQTHLNDRQYQCPTCKKCFVRQHDLKRHAKIHTGIKPYPCECGNSFARHDALTRHRQRGMCIGAFDGIVRKVVKRGRPRKLRPDMDERREKSDRTRRKNTKHTSTSSMSSQSGYSDSSAVNSPSNDFDNLMSDDTHFPDIMDVAITTATMNPSNLTVSTAPMPSPPPRTLAPQALTMSPPDQRDLDETAVSPSAMSNYSHHTHNNQQSPGQQYHHQNNTADYSGLPALPPSSPGAKSVASHYTHIPGTPPELSASSSPPPSAHDGGGPRFYDLSSVSGSGDVSGISDASSIGLGTTMAAHAAAITSGDDDDLLALQFGSNCLEDTTMNMMLSHGGGHQKFSVVDVSVEDADYSVDAACVNMSMFTESDEMFFGS